MDPGWLAWAGTVVLELMSIASGLELRRRKRARTSTVFPASVLACAVTLSLAAQVVETEPSPIGWIAAAVPALGFLVMVKVALGYAGTEPQPTPPGPHTICRAGPRSSGRRTRSSRCSSLIHRWHARADLGLGKLFRIAAHVADAQDPHRQRRMRLRIVRHQCIP